MGVEHQRQQALGLGLGRREFGRRRGRARSPPRRGCGRADRRRRPPPSHARRRRRSPRARRRGARAGPRARGSGTARRRGGSSPWRGRGAGPSPPGETRKAEPIAAASRPRIVCSIRGARIDSSIAGWAQANISASRRSGIDASLSAASSSSPISRSASAEDSALRRRRAPSMSRRRAAVASQPSGLAGTPSRRPDGERGGEGVGERVLRRRHVPRRGRRERRRAGRSSRAPRGWRRPGQEFRSRAQLSDSARSFLVSRL